MFIKYKDTLLKEIPWVKGRSPSKEKDSPWQATGHDRCNRNKLSVDEKILYIYPMKFAALPDFLLDGFDLYPKDEVLRMLLRPIKKTSPQVLLHGRFLHRSLKRIGCVLQLPSIPSSQPPDVVCGRKMHQDLQTTLKSYTSALSSGGLVLLITLRSEMARESICAAFLHAGIVDPVQESTRVFVLTAGVFKPPVAVLEAPLP